MIGIVKLRLLKKQFFCWDNNTLKKFQDISMVIETTISREGGAGGWTNQKNRQIRNARACLYNKREIFLFLSEE